MNSDQNSQYFLITGLKDPEKLRSTLAITMASVAIISLIDTTSIRIDLNATVDLFDHIVLHQVIDWITQGVQDCDEQEPQMGLFTA